MTVAGDSESVVVLVAMTMVRAWAAEADASKFPLPAYVAVSVVPPTGNSVLGNAQLPASLPGRNVQTVVLPDFTVTIPVGVPL